MFKGRVKAYQIAAFLINKNSLVYQLVGVQCVICPIIDWVIGTLQLERCHSGKLSHLVCELGLGDFQQFCLISFFIVVLFLRNLVTSSPVIWPDSGARC